MLEQNRRAIENYFQGRTLCYKRKGHAGSCMGTQKCEKDSEIDCSAGGELIDGIFKKFMLNGTDLAVA